MKMTLKDAVEYCNNLKHAGYTDWRLPSIEELISIIDYSQHNPALPEGHPFNGVQSYYYWSSSTYANGSYSAWYVFMGNGYVYLGNKYNYYYVWPVRGGQFDHLGNLVIPGVPDGRDRFTGNGDGTVTDNRTELMWMQQD